MQNYFNYFTEIEEHYCRRRGSGLLLSSLDWALIETWKDAGIPLAAVLRGIDDTFDRYDQRKSHSGGSSRKINSLAYCSQAVLTAAEDMKEAATGAAPARAAAGLEQATVAAYLRGNAALMRGKLEGLPAAAQTLALASAGALEELAGALEQRAGTSPGASPSASLGTLEDVERRLTVMEEKLFAALLAATADDELVALRTEADRELAPFRRKMPGTQIEQLHRQYVHKRLIERRGLPRLSLFYM